MYDNFKKCSDYYDLKHYLIDTMNGDVENYDLDGVCGHAKVLEESKVFGYAKVSGHDVIDGDRGVFSYLVDTDN